MQESQFLLLTTLHLRAFNPKTKPKPPKKSTDHTFSPKSYPSRKEPNRHILSHKST